MDEKDKPKRGGLRLVGGKKEKGIAKEFAALTPEQKGESMALVPVFPPLPQPTNKAELAEFCSGSLVQHAPTLIERMMTVLHANMADPLSARAWTAAQNIQELYGFVSKQAGISIISNINNTQNNLTQNNTTVRSMDSVIRRFDEESKGKKQAAMPPQVEVVDAEVVE